MKLRLKELREATGKSRREVAADLGIAVGTLRNWEQGVRDLKGRNLVRLADYYEVDAISDLYVIEGFSENPMVSRLVDIVSGMSDDELERVLEFAEFVDNR